MAIDLDQELVAQSLRCYVRRAGRTRIILGRSNVADREVFLEQAKRDKVTIERRLGGGGAVVLTGGMVTISLAKQVHTSFQNQYFFDQINGVIVRALQALGVKGITLRLL